MAYFLRDRKGIRHPNTNEYYPPNWKPPSNSIVVPLDTALQYFKATGSKIRGDGTTPGDFDTQALAAAVINDISGGVALNLASITEQRVRDSFKKLGIEVGENGLKGYERAFQSRNAEASLAGVLNDQLIATVKDGEAPIHTQTNLAVAQKSKPGSVGAVASSVRPAASSFKPV